MKYIETIDEFLTENKAFDELQSLEKWYEEEIKKLEDIKDYKKWNIKTKLLYKEYTGKKNELLRKPNPNGLAGDMRVKYIYHYTTGDSLIGIIKDNELIGGGDEYGGISFTSHGNLHKRGFVFWYANKYSKGKNHNNVGIKIKFDFMKMKRDNLKFRKGSENMGTHMGEDEIRLLQNELENPLKYIVDIVVFRNKEEDFLNIIEFLKSKKIKHTIV